MISCSRSGNLRKFTHNFLQSNRISYKSAPIPTARSGKSASASICIACLNHCRNDRFYIGIRFAWHRHKQHKKRRQTIFQMLNDPAPCRHIGKDQYSTSDREIRSYRKQKLRLRSVSSMDYDMFHVALRLKLPFIISHHRIIIIAESKQLFQKTILFDFIRLGVPIGRDRKDRN